MVLVHEPERESKEERLLYQVMGVPRSDRLLYCKLFFISFESLYLFHGCFQERKSRGFQRPVILDSTRIVFLFGSRREENKGDFMSIQIISSFYHSWRSSPLINSARTCGIQMRSESLFRMDIIDSSISKIENQPFKGSFQLGESIIPYKIFSVR